MNETMNEFAAESQADRDAENLAENLEQDNIDAMSITQLVTFITDNCKQIRDNVDLLVETTNAFASHYENK